MPGSAADVVESTLQDFDISDDGYDRIPGDHLWPAPKLGDDRSNAYEPIPGYRPRAAIFDAYAFLRHEPHNPVIHSYPKPYVHVIIADAHGFVSLADAGTIHEICGLSACGFVDAAGFSFADAGDILSEIRRWHGVMLDILARYGGIRPDAAANAAITAAFQRMSNAAGTKDAMGSVENAHAVTLREARRILKREPPKALTDNVTAHARNMAKLIPGGGGFFKALGSAVTSVGSAIVSTAKDVAKVAAPLISVIKVVAPFAQTALSFVPGVGTVVNGAIAAGAALAQGKSITQALVDTAAAAIPGGPLAKQAFSTGLAIVKGQNVATAALDAVRNQLPGGLAAKAAFDTAVALAHGQSLQKAALSGATQLAKGAVSTLATTARSQGMDLLKQLSPTATRALSSVGPSLLRKVGGTTLPSLLPTQVKMVAQAVLNNPALRSLPISDLARRMNVTEHDARAGVASIVQSVAKAGGSSVPRLAPAQHIADRLPGRASFDQAMAAFASRARPPVFTHNALRRLGVMGFVDAGDFVDAGALPPTIQQGSAGVAVQQWQQIIGATADGKFGPQTKAMTVAWQRSHGLVADGIVGPKTWAAALGSSPTSTPATQKPAAPLPQLPSAPPPVVVATLANQLPQLSLGSTGPAVVKWQQIIKASPDGKFGPQTKQLTIAWQKSRGLVADGIVGPKTWAAAMTSPAAMQTPAPMPMPIPTAPIMQPVSLPPIPDFSAPPAPVAMPIPTAPLALPPSVTTFPMPPIPTPSGTPPFIPGQISTVMTPDGPVIGTTDRTGREVTVTQPPITGSPGPGAVGVLLVLGTLIAVGSSGKRGFL